MYRVGQQENIRLISKRKKDSDMSFEENFLTGIKDKVIAITGASSGIGEATALLLAERGAKVVLGARGLDRLETVAARIANMGGEVVYARTDVKRRDDLTALVKFPPLMTCASRIGRR
jgi:NADP-dependent 3-hydroxy acid dehydrogenase YdfG